MPSSTLAPSATLADQNRPLRIRQRLRWVRWVALADLTLLIALVTVSRLGHRELVSVLGPIHGANFLALLVLVYTGVTDRLWHWGFLAGTFFTGGPLGALVGELVIMRRLQRGERGAA